jgi:hypothetical protein
MKMRGNQSNPIDFSVVETPIGGLGGGGEGLGNIIEVSCTWYIGVHDLHVDSISPASFVDDMIRSFQIAFFMAMYFRVRLRHTMGT